MNKEERNAILFCAVALFAGFLFDWLLQSWGF